MATSTLVVGATGKTGRYVVQFLLDQSPTSHVKVLCRDATKMKNLLSKKDNDEDDNVSLSHRLTIVEGSILKLTMEELEDLTKDCSNVVSCLGHNGMWGKEDRFLVSDSVARLTSVLQSTTTTTTTTAKKFVLMASEGCAVPGDDPRGFWDGLLLSLIRWLVPPHVDNELACAHLLLQQQSKVSSSPLPPEWVIVRPCDLVNDNVDTTTTTTTTTTKKKTNKYVLHSKPTGRLFGSGTVSRASVAQFMTDLILNPQLWEDYKYQAPVIHGAPSVETDKTK